jgi:diguanylate cyclase (GGDEF)-like protein
MTSSLDLIPISEALLSNILTLTAQRDQVSLEYSLLMAMDDILEPSTLIALEWIGDSEHFQVVYEGTATIRPPESILAAAQALSETCQHLGVESGTDWLVMPIVAMTENTRRAMVLGLKKWTDSDIRMARGMLRVYQNFVQLLNDSEKDTLTGLMNRRRLEKHLAELLTTRRNKRRSDDLARRDFLAVLDIDRFKLVNDTYGHLIGDEVLLLFANIMRKSLRDEDRCYRYGGEEFIVLLANISRSNALMVLERLRDNIAKHEFPQVGHITVSIGLTLVENLHLPSGIIEEADRALYYAKAHGRNQVREYQALVQAGEIQVPDISGTVELF